MPNRRTTYHYEDGSAPEPPEGGWIRAQVGSQLGTTLIRYIQSGQITAVSSCLTTGFIVLIEIEYN